MSLGGIAFCLAEDRPDCETGLRLAILGLVRHCPDTPVYAFGPPADSSFAGWVRQFPQVTHIPGAPPGADTWNCKPHALKPILGKGYRDVVWLDSDILVTRDVRRLFRDLDDRTLLIAQEPASLPAQGTERRTKGWNLEVGRNLPFTLNSAVVRVTSYHLSLLDRWEELLGDSSYVSAQALPLGQRPLHMMSDQDVINALLGAREFADVPLHVLRSGVDIIHAGGGLGYSVLERCRGVFKRKPAFFHATAGKPWLWLGGEPQWSQPDFFSWNRRLLQELSPYLTESRQYRAQLGIDSHWMSRHTGIGSLLRTLGFGHFAIRGLPVTVVASIMIRLKKQSM